MNQKVARLCIIRHAIRWQVSASARADPKEKSKYETFGKSVAVVGRFGRNVCIWGYPQSANSLGTDYSVRSVEEPELQRVVDS